MTPRKIALANSFRRGIKKSEKTARYIRCIARMCQCNSCESTHLPHSYAHGVRISVSLSRELLL
jgi:hypothetical protein